MTCKECERIKNKMLENLRKDMGLPKQDNTEGEKNNG